MSALADYTAAVYDVRMSDSKVCRTCKEAKPFSAFGRRKANADGYETRCKACWNSYRKDYLLNNPDVAAKRRLENTLRGRRIRSTESGRARIREATKRWREKNREQARALGRAQYGKREALKRNAGSHYVSTKEALSIVSRPCSNCGSRENIHLDHIVPLSRGGAHSIGNLQPLCAYCNISKGASLQVEWRYCSGNIGKSYVESGIA